LIKQWTTIDNVILVGEDVAQFETEAAAFKRLSAPPLAAQVYPPTEAPRSIHTFTPQNQKLSKAEKNRLNHQN
ncbi:tRNA (adenosine(37)-N6)-threonylcarbamoyltransferase complex dimerization subunit type 1 TsaB, partial [Staphylococcus pseudintermedius]